MTTQPWILGALCAQDDPDRLFVRGSAQRNVRAICFECPVRLGCLTEALASGAEYGIWGGLTERERRAVRKVRPAVVDWAGWLKTADPLAVELRRSQPPRTLISFTRSLADAS